MSDTAAPHPKEHQQKRKRADTGVSRNPKPPHSEYATACGHKIAERAGTAAPDTAASYQSYHRQERADTTVPRNPS